VVIEMLELFKSVKLDKNSGTPLYMQLSDKIAEMIENGILPADLKLPSIRQMSALLNVNSVTIVSCTNTWKQKAMYIPAGKRYVCCRCSAQAKRKLLRPQHYTG